MINKVTLVGKLKRDVELFTSLEGQRFASLTVDTWHSWVDKDTGKRRSKHETHNVLTFRKDLFGYLERHGKSGARIYLEGALGSVKQEVEGSPVPVKIAAVLVHRDGTIRFLDLALESDTGDTDVSERTNTGVVDLPSLAVSRS